jgi:hypothetical protein
VVGTPPSESLSGNIVKEKKEAKSDPMKLQASVEDQQEFSNNTNQDSCKS